MSGAHTPGPWEIIQLPSMSYRIDAKVGSLHVCPAIAHGLADANLIVAAPDLLEAAKLVLAMREGCWMTHEDAYDCMFKSGGRDQWNALAAAIAKATGEKA